MKPSCRLPILFFVAFCLSTFSNAGFNEIRVISPNNFDLLDAIVSIEIYSETDGTECIGSAFLVESPNNHTLLFTSKNLVLKSDEKIKPNLAYRFNRKSGVSILIFDDQMSSKAGDWYFSKNHDVACRFIVPVKDYDVFKVPIEMFFEHSRIQPVEYVVVLGRRLGVVQWEANVNTFLINRKVTLSERVCEKS